MVWDWEGTGFFSVGVRGDGRGNLLPCHPLTYSHTPLPDIVYFSLSKRIGTPENHISVAPGCPSPPSETEEMEQKKERERESERRRGRGVIQARQTDVPVIFSQ